MSVREKQLTSCHGEKVKIKKLIYYLTRLSGWIKVMSSKPPP